jgi:organic radical activating enzyme
MIERSYYCSVKFKFVKIDVETRQTYNCHAATPHKIDFDWLKANPGQLFNTDINVLERQQMLRNERNISCEQNCWPAEDHGLVSSRIIQLGQAKTHINPITQPEVIDLTIGSGCNLSCSYCSKEFSSTWRNDILNNGNYNITPDDLRYTANTFDRVISQVSQAEKYNSQQYKILLNELRLISHNLNELHITGGEPFLNKFLLDIIESNKNTPTIKLFTGLGVDYKRFERILDRLADYKNVKLSVSAENIGPLHEFNRYGTKWREVERKLDLVIKKNVNLMFHSTLSNLTLFGFVDFYNRFNQFYIETDVVHTPIFLKINNMDNNSKLFLKEQLSNSSVPKKDEYIASLDSEFNVEHRIQLRKFINEFTKRRPDLNLDIFPKTFLDWISSDGQ